VALLKRSRRLLTLWNSERKSKAKSPAAKNNPEITVSLNPASLELLGEAE
jgi:hypothetical protein